MSNVPKVFISYAHDSASQDLVLGLANRLRDDGIDAIIDQFVVFPAEGWPRWMETQISQTDFVLIVCSDKYKRRAEGLELPNIGKGVKWEGSIIYNLIYGADSLNTKFVPILLKDGKPEHIPVPLQGFTYFKPDVDNDYDNLLRVLRNDPSTIKAPLGILRPIPPHKRQSAFLIPWNVPVSRNPFFSGREDILQKLHETLRYHGLTPLIQPKAISGLGGIGKTQIAIEYAYRFVSSYSAILWVTVDSKGALMSEFASLTEVLDLPEKDSLDQRVQLKAVMRWLSRNVDWLLILDNADDPLVLKDMLPTKHGGYIILTSRAKKFENLGVSVPIEVLKMDPGEAQEFFLRRTGRFGLNQREKRAVEEIAKQLDYLPLAMEQAGAYIDRMKCSFGDYLASYERRGLGLLERSMPATGNYPKSVLTTWTMNFKQVHTICPESVDVLRLSAFLAPDKIPLSILREGARELGSSLRKALLLGDTLAANELVEPLAEYSLIKFDVQSQTYDIHRLTQAVIVEAMDKKAQFIWVRRAVEAMNIVFPDVEDFSQWDRCSQILPHSQAAASAGLSRRIKSAAIIQLLNKIGRYLYKRARYAEAEHFLIKALSMAEVVLNPDSVETPNIMNNLGALNWKCGKFVEAEEFYLKSLAIRKRIYGDRHLDIAESLNNLGIIYWEQHKYDDAEIVYIQALAMRQKSLGEYDPLIAETLNNLAVLYWAKSNYRKSEQLHKKVLATRRKAFGLQHPLVAQSLSNLGLVYRSDGRYLKAEPVQTQALSMRKNTLGLEHPETCESLGNLASLYGAMGRYEDAELLDKQAWEIREKLFGRQHPDVARSINHLAWVYTQKGKYKEAESLFKEALTIRQRVLGLSHPQVGVTLEDYADMLRKTGRIQAAVRLEKRIKRIILTNSKHGG